jgi:hypothetical protein
MTARRPDQRRGVWAAIIALAHMQETRRKSFGADALCGDAGSLQKEMEFVGQYFRLAQAGLLA